MTPSLPLRALSLSLLATALPACANAPVDSAALEDEPLATATQSLVAACDQPSIYADAPASAIPFFDRAFSWVDAGAMYCQCVTDATAPYRADCSGLVSYAWELAPPGHTTYSFAGGPWDDGQSVVISWDELAAGDALNFPGNPNTGVGHIMLFAGWLDADHTKLCAVEESSSGTPAHISQHSIYDPGAWWGGGGSFGDIFLPVRLTGYAPTPPNKAPQGWLDAAGCDSIRGWAQDPDSPDQALDVHLYFDSNPGDPNAKAFSTSAAVHRDDLCQAIGSCDHGFSVAPPRSLLDGQPHSVQAFAIDTAGGQNPLLAGSPQTLQCDPPAPPLSAQQGVKRWVTSPDVFAAWRFDWLRDLATEPDSVVASYPDGPDMPASPEVVQADDGTPEVWVIDSGVRRHVIDPSSFGAWRFDAPGALAVKPASEVYQHPVGADFPSSPFVFASPSDPKVYVLDSAPPPPEGTGGTGGSSGAGAGPSTGGSSGGDGGSEDADDSASNRRSSCSATPESSSSSMAVWLSVGLLVTAAAVRRRTGSRAALCE